MSAWLVGRTGLLDDGEERGVTKAGLLLVGCLLVGSCAAEPAGSGVERAAARPALTPSTVAPPLADNGLNGEAVEQVLARIEAELGIPAALPPGLPAGTALAARRPLRFLRFSPRHQGATLDLTFPGGELKVGFGYVATFTGCDAPPIRQARIGDEPALAVSYARGVSAVVWPATPGNRVGRYGLSGDLPLRQIIRLAERLDEHLGRAGAPKPSLGC